MPARLGRRRRNAIEPGWPGLVSPTGPQTRLISSADSYSAAQSIVAVIGTTEQLIPLGPSYSDSRAQPISAVVAVPTVTTAAAFGAIRAPAERAAVVVGWTVDGRAVPAEWSTFTMVAPGGYDRAELRVPRQKMPSGAGQGSVVRANRSDGEVMYEGRIAATPKVSDGRYEFQVEGNKRVVERKAKRIPWQLQDASEWQERYADPFNYANDRNIDLFTRRHGLGFAVSKNITYPSGALNGYALQLKGYSIQRVAFTFNRSDPDAAYDVMLRSADRLGKQASFTTLETWGGDTADETSVDVTLDVGPEIVELILRANQADTPTQNEKWWLTSLRVNAFSNTDNDTTSDIANHIGAASGYDTHVLSGAVSPMPFDWTGDWASALDYLSALEDWTWLVEHGGRTSPGALYYGPWGRTAWTTTLAAGATESLVMLPLYNQATTTYEKPAGVVQTETTFATSIGLSDPLAGTGVISEWPDPVVLNDPQRDDTLAQQVNARLLGRITAQRVQGSIRISQMAREGQHPFDIRAGDTIDLADFEPRLPPQRITGVSYNADGTATLTLGSDVMAGLMVGLQGNVKARARQRARQQARRTARMSRRRRKLER